MAAANGQGVMAVNQSINPIDALAESRAVRHFGKLIGLAAAVAVGMVVVLWSAEPNYSPLFQNMSGKDAAQVADVLMSRDIQFKLDSSSGALLVDQSKISEARMLLASQGLSGGNSQGMEMLQQDQGLGTSQFIETARYNHALEAELVRSVESIRSVEKARVHLAIPEQSIFIRSRTKPSASVFVKLHSGRVLNPGQVEAIVQMIASSIPMLESSEVKVVDQFGRLLTTGSDAGMGKSSRQFDYTRRLENRYVDSIIALLQPIIGEGNVNAQVAAQINYSAVESTREAYDPERSVIRSEQVNEQSSRSSQAMGGIPGALTNQPPIGGTIALKGEGGGGISGGSSMPGNQVRSATRNYELDRVISHTSSSTGDIERLSVAVVIDDKQVIAADGSVSKTPYSDAEIESFTNLVKKAIGFDPNRGDSVTVINTSFMTIAVPVMEAVPAWQGLLQEAWIANLIKQVLGAIGCIIIYFMFIRPLLRSLTQTKGSAGSDGGEMLAQNAGSPGNVQAPGAFPGQATGPDGHDLASDPNNPAEMLKRKDATYDQKVDLARTMVVDDPARVANVLKQWVGED